ncbi:MAG TPA: hypothetical protein VHY10_16970 [Xanthobacteraceae bacterium]|jgi:hypothetical protein|nr:hypothetical protein [Xanthobacteraceae bacterium]
MTGHLAKAIDDCRKHAAHCARKANAALDREAREDFLRLEQSWLQLARSYEVAQVLMEDSKPNDHAA